MRATPSIHNRTPMVTIELQLRPAPPPDAHPYCWGLGTVSFYDGPDHQRKVWEGTLPDQLAARGGVQIKRRDDYWVAVYTYTHDEAREFLSKMCLPDHVDGAVSDAR